MYRPPSPPRAYRCSRRPCSMSDLENLSLSVSWSARAFAHCLRHSNCRFMLKLCAWVSVCVPITDVLFVSSHTLIAHYKKNIDIHGTKQRKKLNETKKSYFDVSKHFKISPWIAAQMCPRTHSHTLRCNFVSVLFCAVCMWRYCYIEPKINAIFCCSKCHLFFHSN